MVKHLQTMMIIVSCLLASCSKPPPGPGNGTEKKDTLSAGWTMSKIDLEQFTNIRIVQNKGIAVSTSAIYNSADGGVSWQKRLSYGNQALGTGYAWRRNIGMDTAGNVIIPQGYGNRGGGISSLVISHDFYNFSVVPDIRLINDSWFWSNNNGYAISANDQDTNIHFFKTVNGGTSWTDLGVIPRKPIITNVGMTHLAFVNSQVGWASTPYGVYKTINGGLDWTFQHGPSGIISHISAVDANTCFIKYFSNQGFNTVDRIGKTTDGGANWQEVFNETSRNGVEAIWFVSASTGYMTRGNGIYKSTDGGSSWNKVVAINSSQCGFMDIFFTDANHGWACSVGGQIVRFVQ